MALTATGSQLQWAPALLTTSLAPGQEEIELVFVARNPGSTSVAITLVEPSCECTSAVVEPRTIAAGSSAELRAIYRAGGRSGLVRRDIRVRTDSGDDTLTFEVKHPEWYSIERPNFIWAPGSKRTGKTTRIALVAGVQAEFGPPRVAKPELFAATVEPLSGSRGEFLVRVEPLVETGPLFSPIVLPVRFSDGRTATITMHAALR